MNRRLYPLMAFLGTAIVLHTGTVEAVVVLPSDLNSGDSYRLVYVTSQTISGSFTDTSTYNSFADDVANNNGGFSGSLISGISSWDAIISSNDLSARENTSTVPGTDGAGIPIYNILGQRLADSYADFWDGLLATDVASSVAGTERDTAPPLISSGEGDVQGVWTGTASDGTTSLPVGAGTTTRGVSLIIPGNLFADSWVEAASRTSASSLPIYGISSILTVGPEPETFMFMGGAEFDVKATPDGGGGFSLTEGETSINVQKVDLAAVDRRGVLEFDISSIPAGAPIVSASIDFSVIAFTGGSDGPMVRLFGYVGNGTPDTTDAEQISTLIGVGDQIDSLGPTSISIDPMYVQSQLGQTDFLGVTMLGSENGTQFGFRTLEDESLGFGPSAKLSIVYGVPEPSTLALAAIALFALLGYSYRRRALP